MGKLRQILSRTACRLELPADILAGVPRLELTGWDEVRMEPHGGLLEYQPERITIDSSLGPVMIRGRDLTIKQMNEEQITLSGRILGVELPGEPYE